MPKRDGLEVIVAYTALEKMRKKLEREFGRDVGPLEPWLASGAECGFDLKSAALRFIHNSCEGLRFDACIEEEEKRTGELQGTSLSYGQIPYNMQMDINRLCLERELERFIDSGATQDAYNVYYCFEEIFLKDCVDSKKLVDLLGECESSVSTLLMEHRDHYSHSVYVFVLGLAIFETNANFRRAFCSFYHLDDCDGADGPSSAAANFFLEFWGLTALFHDIGYPFELVFEQVMSYFGTGDDERGEGIPYIAYQNVAPMVEIGSETKDCLERLYGRRFSTINELLAYDTTQKLGEAYGFDEDYLRDLLDRKPVAPKDFAYYMDHGYFSAIRLFRALEGCLDNGAKDKGPAQPLTKAHVDALGAILLHYVVFRYSLAPCSGKDVANLRMELHPLAWLLMLTDELQCWDRTSYGRNTKCELHPMGIELDLSRNRIVACYLFDEREQAKIDAYHEEYVAWKKAGKPGRAPRLKAYSDFVRERGAFAADIEELVDTTSVPLTVLCVTAPVDRSSKHVYLSEGSFSHVRDFAVALNARYSHEGREGEVSAEELEAEFEALSLEYKLSNINQVKFFDRYLNAIRCFYTDRPVDFDLLEAFTPEQIARIAPMEHERWVREHQAMGWHHGDDYERADVPPDKDDRTYRKMLREQMRCHKLAMDGELTHEAILEHYQNLEEDDKGKDWLPFNNLLRLIEVFDGLRIYQLPHD